MEVLVESKVVKEINETSILQQTSFWSQVKRKQGIESKAFDIKVKTSDLYAQSDCQRIIIDDVLILFQNIGSDHRIAYVPYGPTLKPCEENQGVFLEELSESLRQYLPSDCVMLRYDLLWESIWAKDDSYYNERGDWLGPPAIANQEIRLNFDTQNWNLKKANTNILPSDTVLLDLKKDESQLLKEMKSKTRYNIRLSYRKDVHVRKANINDFTIWTQLYRETCARNKIFLDNEENFKCVLRTQLSDTGKPANVDLLIAEMDNIPLAAMFLAYSDKRATYLYGASSTKNRNSMATYALQWDAILRAKKNGCTEYDMFGVAPYPDSTHPLYGLFRFKTGFGGRIFHRMGCWDYPLDTDCYDVYLASEMTSEGYHLN